MQRIKKQNILQTVPWWYADNYCYYQILFQLHIYIFALISEVPKDLQENLQITEARCKINIQASSRVTTVLVWHMLHVCIALKTYHITSIQKKLEFPLTIWENDNSKNLNEQTRSQI